MPAQAWLEYSLIHAVSAAQLLSTDGGTRHRGISKISTSSGKLRQQAETLRSTALVLAKSAARTDIAAALRQLRESARLFREAHINDKAAVDYLSMGEIYFIRSRYPQTLDMYHRALRLAGGLNTKSLVLAHIAVAEATVGDIAESLKHSHQALDLDASLSAKSEASVALGFGLLFSKDPQHAIEILKSAAENFKALGDKDGQARALFYMGVAALEAGSLTDAFDHEKRALDLWTSAGNAHGTAEAHQGLGLLYITVGEPGKALGEYRLARKIFQSMGDRDSEGIVLNGLGVVSTELGNHEMALLYDTQARNSFAVVGDRLGELSAIVGAAKAQWSLRKYSEAARLYNTELRRAQQIQNYRVEASALFNLGDVYEHEHDYTRAERFYAKSLALCRSVHNVFSEIEALVRLGRLYAETDRQAQALQSFKDALQRAESTDRVANQAQTHYELARVHKALHHIDEAKAEAESAIQIIESERTKVSDFESRATYFASVHQYYQLYIDLLMQLHQQFPDQHFDQRALEASEKSKVRSLLDMVALPDTSTACPGSGEPQPGHGFPDQSEKASQCTHAASALSFKQIQAELQGDNAVLVEYALGPDSSYLWVMDGSQLYSYTLPGEAEISRLTTAFGRDLIARQPLAHEDATDYGQRVAKADTEIPIVARQLSQMLLGPVAHLLGRKRIITVPDGNLRYVPFAALPLPDSDSANQQPLAAEHEIVSLPSASILNALRQAEARRAQPTAMAAVFADPVYSRDDSRISGHSSGKPTLHSDSVALGKALRDAGFGPVIPRLPNSRVEATTIKETWPDKEVLSALDFDASRGAVLAANLGRFRYIHFAAHGLLDTKHPEFSGLILSLVDHNGQTQDGYLRMRDIYNLKLAADLVVLSSCNSALGKDLQSEGIIGLPRAFLYAGSQRVVSTLWKIDDRASAELMRYFYSGLRRGESPAAALREAQMILVRDPNWHYPYYWAAFVLQGEYR